MSTDKAALDKAANATASEPVKTIALRDGSGVVDVREAFANRFPALAPTEEMLAVFEENLGGEELGVGDFQRVKVPAAELNSWIVLEDGEEVSKRTLVGVPIAIKPRRAFWQPKPDGSNDPDGSQPDCSSTDNKVPVSGGMYAPDGPMGAQNPQGMCRTCPMAARNSGPNGSSACREQRLVFLMRDGAMFPQIVQVPRTSIKAFRQWAMSLAESGTPYYGVEVELALEKGKNSQGTAYNKITLRTKSKLTPDERKAAQIFGQQIKDMIDAAAADFSDSAVNESAGDGGVSVGDGPAT